MLVFVCLFVLISLPRRPNKGNGYFQMFLLLKWVIQYKEHWTACQGQESGGQTSVCVHQLKAIIQGLTESDSVSILLKQKFANV